MAATLYADKQDSPDADVTPDVGVRCDGMNGEQDSPDVDVRCDGINGVC